MTISLQAVINLIQREIDYNLAAWGQASTAQAKDRYNYTVFRLIKTLEVLKSYAETK
jgi:hypothetical protein